MAASTRPVKLDKYGITWEEYKELSYFCLQYQRKKQEAADLLTMRISTPAPATYHVNGVEYGTFLPHGQGQTSDPVFSQMAKREKLLSDVRMIEKAARMAGDGDVMAPYILRVVTTRDGARKVKADMEPPCGINKLFEMRRRFYYILREMRNGEAPA